MSQFTLTAKMTVPLVDGSIIQRGTEININLPYSDAFCTQSVFGNLRFRDTILRQMSAQGLDLPPATANQYLHSGLWDIQMNR